MTLLDQTCKANDSDYYYANIDVKDVQGKSTSETMFRNSYSRNFGGASTRLITVTGDEGIVSFKTLYNDLELPYKSSPVSGLYYTNHIEIPMFETVGINLLVYRNKNEEINIDFKKYDGFIYIPDYYADYIIENTDYIDDYFDILNTNDTNVIYFEFNERIFKYRIANIFHVKGFNSKYTGNTAIKYTDYNNGQKLDYLFNGFCFVSNYNHFTLFDDRFHNTLAVQIGAKKYELEETLLTANKYKNINGAEEAKADIYYHNKNGLFKYNGSDRISSVIFGQRTDGVSVGFTIAFIGTLVLYLAASILSCFEELKLKNDAKQFIVTFVEISLFLLLGYILKKTVRGNSGLVYFFNPYASGISIGLLVATFVLLLFSVYISKKKREEKCE